MPYSKKDRHHKRVRHEDRALCYRYYHMEELIELDQPIELFVVDISAGGVGLKSRQPLNSGFVLIFDLNFGLSTYKIMAKVMWSKQRDSYYRSGLEFVSMPYKLKSEINTLTNLEQAL